MVRKPMRRRRPSHSVQFLAAAMSDLAPKLLHRYRKSSRFAQGGVYRLVDCPLDHGNFEEEGGLVKLTGFLGGLMEIRQTFSTSDIHRHSKSTKLQRRCSSQIKLFSKDYYARKLDDMETSDLFSSACSSLHILHHQRRELINVLDKARTENKGVQLRYIRSRILELFQSMVRFSVTHQKYMDEVRQRKTLDGMQPCILDEKQKCFTIESAGHPLIVKYKEGLDIADLEYSCGDYVSDFNRILRVHQWLKNCEKVAD